jgi:cardiolipin synthase
MLRNSAALAILSISLLLLAGCGSGGTATPTPIPVVSQATLSANLTFPATAAGNTAAAQTVTLTNSGNGPLTISGTAIGGANPADFAQSAATCTGTLAAGTSCTLSITFTPAAASTSYAATLTVTDNSGNAAGSAQSVTLNGTSATPVIAPLATLSPTSLTFAATNTGSTSGSQTLTLSNTGTAALTGISLNAISGTGATAFSQSTTCGATLAIAASCPISVSFSPTATGSYAATLSVANNAAGSPQTVALSGTGVAPQAVLTATTMTFPSTTVNTTSSSISVTLSNPGTATLTGISIGALTGTGAANFAESPATTCGTTLAVNATCTISATFTPTTAISYAAIISIASSATSTPQTISLSGTGTSVPSITRTLYTFPATFPETANPDASVSALYALINSAKTTIDMTMYELQDTTFSGYLVAACGNGVTVRVILSSSEKSNNTPAYKQLNTAGANCSAVLSNTAFTNTHQKTITVDNTTTAIMSLNLQTQYYTTTRDFALVENDPADIADIEATFAADYAAGTPYAGTQGPSDFSSYTPGGGDTTAFSTGDLIWSPTTAQPDMLALINNAASTLLIENEEMSAANIVSALVSACQRGVTVHIAMTNDSNEYGSEFTQLETAGCGVNVYPDTSTGFYVHAKAVVADYGLSTQMVYMGSINYSTASMTKNRELGLYITDQTIIDTLNTTMAADYAGGAAY